MTGTSSPANAAPRPAVPPSPARLSALFEQACTLALFLWPALTLAVANAWGGADSAGKREWFAATLIDVLAGEPDADAAWLEQFLLQVLEDEFEVVVDDGSAQVVAEDLLRVRKGLAQSDPSAAVNKVQAWQARWDARSRGTGGADVAAMFTQGQEQASEGDSEEGDEDSQSGDASSGDEDVEMDEAPQLVKAKPVAAPEVDKDGFTKVTKKKR